MKGKLEVGWNGNTFRLGWGAKRVKQQRGEGRGRGAIAR